MAGWIFQGNLDDFDIDRYLADNDEVEWTVRQEHLAPKMKKGDRVFFWRASGGSKLPAGIVGSGEIIELPRLCRRDREVTEYWSSAHGDAGDALCVRVSVDKGTVGRLLRRENVAEDPVMAKSRIIRVRAGTNFLLTEQQLRSTEGLWGQAAVQPPRGWLLIAFSEEERQHAGNIGYDDDPEKVYRYDSLVPNSKQIKAGDAIVLRSEAMLGVGRITRIRSAEGEKEQRRCPNPTCKKTTIKARKSAQPVYRCHSCKSTFDEPLIDFVSVTKYEAYFDETFVRTPDAITKERLWDACPRFNGNLSMQEIDVAAVAAALGRFPDAAELLKGQASVNVISPSEFDPTDLDDAREKIERAIALRRGQPAFRKALLAAYGGRCAITGCDAPDALEAAHVVPYIGEKTNAVANGLLLRADIHTLFDRHLITIDPESLVVVLKDGLLATEYAELEGVPLRTPGKPGLGPSRQALRDHFERSGRRA